MATARIAYVQPEPPPRQVILELTEEEAGALWAMTRAVGGLGLVREAIDNIELALAPLFTSYANPFEGTLRVKRGAAFPQCKRDAS